MVNRAETGTPAAGAVKKRRGGPLIKEFWRTIRGSLSRFVSLSLILLLGTAFFTGLKVTAPNMVTTVSRYMDDYRLADFTAGTNYGLTADDVEAFSKRPEIEAAAGVIAVDVTVQQVDRQDVLRLHSLPDDRGINSPALVAGRLPQAEDEIAPEAAWATRAGYQIGQELVLNREDGDQAKSAADTENDGGAGDDAVTAAEAVADLKTNCFKIVGLTVSPDYLSTDRGSSRAGHGKVAGYAFVRPELFEGDLYTAVLLRARLDPQEREAAFTNGYSEAINSLRPDLEVFLDRRAEQRRTDIYAEAKKQLAEAEADLEAGRKKAERELQDARRQLDEGRADYQDGVAKLAAGRAELAEGRLEADRKFKAAAEELAANKENLKKQQMAFEQAAGGAALTAAATELSRAEANLLAEKERLQTAQADLAGQMAAWHSLEQQYQQMLAGQTEQETTGPAGTGTVASTGSAAEPHPTGTTASGGVTGPGGTSTSGSSAAPLQTTAPTQPPTQNQSQNPSLSAEQVRLKAAYEAGKAAEPALLKAAADLEEAAAKLKRGEAELEQQKAALSAGQRQQSEAAAKLAAGAAALREGEARLKREQEQADRQMQAAETELAKHDKDLQQAALDLAEGEQRYREESLAAEEKLADGAAKLADGRAKLKDLKPAESYLLDRDANIGFASFKQDSDRIEAISLIFPLIFYAVAALISMTTMTRMVEEERSRIGVFHALGYQRTSIYLKYFAYAALAAGLGSAVGLVLGYRLFPGVIYRAYGLLYDLPPLTVKPYVGISLIAVGLAFVSSLGGVLSVAWRTIREKPAELLRPPAPKEGQRIFLEYVRPLWRRLSFNSKVTCRNIFRYKKRMWMTLAGIAGCTALLVMGFGLQDSMRSLGAIQYGVLQQADAVLSLDKEMASRGDISAATLRQEDSVKAALPVYEQAVTCLPANYDRTRPEREQTYIGHTVLTVPLEPESFADFFLLREPGGEPQNLREGVLITDKLARRLKVGVGDRIRMQPSLAANDRLESNRDLLLLKTEVELTVAGVVENHYGHRLFMLPDTFAHMCLQQSAATGVQTGVEEDGKADGAGRELYPTRVYLKWRTGADADWSGAGSDQDQVVAPAKEDTELAEEPADAVANLLKIDGVSACSLLSEEKAMLMSRADQLGAVLLIIILAAGLLAYVVLFNLSSINLTERRRELATLKVLGFTKRELNSYIFRENIILTFLGTLAGLGLGTALHHYLVRTVETESLSMSLQINWQSFVWSALLTICFSLLVNLQMLPRLQKINMVESLKSVE